MNKLSSEYEVIGLMPNNSDIFAPDWYRYEYSKRAAIRLAKFAKSANTAFERVLVLDCYGKMVTEIK